MPYCILPPPPQRHQFCRINIHQDKQVQKAESRGGQLATLQQSAAQVRGEAQTEWANPQESRRRGARG